MKINLAFPKEEIPKQGPNWKFLKEKNLNTEFQYLFHEKISSLFCQEVTLPHDALSLSLCFQWVLTQKHS